MPSNLNLDYYYGTEAEQYSFYRVPKTLLTDPRFKSVSIEAKVLYGLLLDRMGLSVKNGWMDKERRVYIYFTQEDAMALMNCGKDKATRLFRELDQNGIGLIERKKQGQGRPARIYVKNFTLPTEPGQTTPCTVTAPTQETHGAPQTAESQPSRPLDSAAVKTAPFEQSAPLELRDQDSGFCALTLIEWKNTPITAQIQITKKSADYNPTNGLPAGTLLEGAVFEIRDKAGNLVDTICSDSRGVAASKPLPLGRYTIKEVKAPANYGVSDQELTAYLEHPGEIVRFEVTNKALSTGVSITKTGPKQVMAGQPVRYVFSNIGNNSNVMLTSFYWRDTLPAEVRLDSVVTGTYNFPGTYKITYRVNGGEYRSKEEFQEAQGVADNALMLLSTATKHRDSLQKEHATFRKLLSTSDKEIPLSEIMGYVDKIVVDDGKQLMVKWRQSKPYWGEPYELDKFSDI